MTTIVYRDGVLVGDTAIFDRDAYCGTTTKVFRLVNGALGGLCGCMGDMAIFKEWFLHHRHSSNGIHRISRKARNELSGPAKGPTPHTHEG